VWRYCNWVSHLIFLVCNFMSGIFPKSNYSFFFFRNFDIRQSQIFFFISYEEHRTKIVWKLNNKSWKKWWWLTKAGKTNVTTKQHDETINKIIKIFKFLIRLLSLFGPLAGRVHTNNKISTEKKYLGCIQLTIQIFTQISKAKNSNLQVIR
jgi:hypothetical protein